EAGQRAEVHDLALDPLGPAEAVLPDAAHERHLAALEVERRLAPRRAMALALGAAARGLAEPATRPARPAAAGPRPGSGLEPIQHLSVLHPHEVRDLHDHAAHGRPVGHLDRLVQAP